MKRPPPTCSDCASFEDDPFVLEATFKAMRTLSSAWASVRGDSGVCRVDDRFKMPRPACEHFARRRGEVGEGGRTEGPRGELEPKRAARRTEP